MDGNSQSLYIYNGSYYTDQWYEWLAFLMLRISMFVKDRFQEVLSLPAD